MKKKIDECWDTRNQYTDEETGVKYLRRKANLHSEAEKSFLVKFKEFYTVCWIPKSLCDFIGRGKQDYQITVSIPEWLYKEKELEDMQKQFLEND
jgi:hypothetical protein